VEAMPEIGYRGRRRDTLIRLGGALASCGRREEARDDAGALWRSAGDQECAHGGAGPDGLGAIAEMTRARNRREREPTRRGGGHLWSGREGMEDRPLGSPLFEVSFRSADCSTVKEDGRGTGEAGRGAPCARKFQAPPVEVLSLAYLALMVPGNADAAAEAARGSPRASAPLSPGEDGSAAGPGPGHRDPAHLEGAHALLVEFREQRSDTDRAMMISSVPLYREIESALAGGRQGLICAARPMKTADVLSLSKTIRGARRSNMMQWPLRVFCLALLPGSPSPMPRALRLPGRGGLRIGNDRGRGAGFCT